MTRHKKVLQEKEHAGDDTIPILHKKEYVTRHLLLKFMQFCIQGNTIWQAVNLFPF